MKTPPIPVALLDTAFSLPVDRNPDPEFRPPAIRLHELFDFTDQSGGRVVELEDSPDGPTRAYLVNSRHAEDYDMVLGAERGIVAASLLATARLEAFVASLPQADVLGTLKAAAEMPLPGRTVAGFLLVSSDTWEFIAMRAGPFWPDLNGCGRLGTICSDASLAETLHWPDPADAGAVAVARTAYQRLPTVKLADEIVGRMEHAGMSLPVDYLSSDDGSGVQMRTYTCFAVAEDGRQWTEWKEALLTGKPLIKDGSTFALLTRDEVYGLIDDEAAAAKLRSKHLSGIGREALQEEARLERRAVERAKSPFDERTERATRLQLAEERLVPTQDRGAFPCFDAQASAFKTVFVTLGLL